MANQYKNKVIYNGIVLIDLTNDTVEADKLASGYTAHKSDGSLVTGTLSFVNYYTSSSEPTSAQGNDGDIWLVTE